MAQAPYFARLKSIVTPPLPTQPVVPNWVERLARFGFLAVDLVSTREMHNVPEAPQPRPIFASLFFFYFLSLFRALLLVLMI